MESRVAWEDPPGGPVLRWQQVPGENHGSNYVEPRGNGRKALRNVGFECFHWGQVGDSRASDALIMEWARQNGAIVVTHDLDFSAMLAASKDASPSVIQIRLQDVLSEQFIGVLVESLRHFSEMLDKGAIVVVDEKGQRARALPLR